MAAEEESPLVELGGEGYDGSIVVAPGGELMVQAEEEDEGAEELSEAVRAEMLALEVGELLGAG